MAVMIEKQSYGCQLIVTLLWLRKRTPLLQGVFS